MVQCNHTNTRNKNKNTLFDILKELENLYGSYELPRTDDLRNNRNWWAKYELSRKRNKAALGLLVHQGITTTEADRLTHKDLRLREGTVYIAGSRKSNERDLELKPHQIMELIEYSLQTRKQLLEFTRKETEQLFVSIETSTQ